jgi:hypothetical protein
VTLKLRMLAACECSGLVRDAFAARGWEAWSADLLPSETPANRWLSSRPVPYGDAPGYHYQGDCRDLFDAHHPVNFERTQTWHQAYATWALWDLVIAFPPCTHLSLAGAVWWKVKRMQGPNGEPSLQDEAADFFMQMVRAPAPYVAVENPRGDMTRRYEPPDQYVQPYMFGDPLIKATGLWLKGLPLLVPDDPVEPAGRVASGGGSCRTDTAAGRGMKFVNGHEDAKGRANRQRERNRTLPGLARAMAAQWGSYVEREEAA